MQGGASCLTEASCPTFPFKSMDTAVKRRLGNSCVFLCYFVKNCERSRKASRHETIHDETDTFCPRPRPGPSRPRPKTPNFGFETETLSRDLASLNIMVVNSRISIEHFKQTRGYLDLVTVHCVQYWTHVTGNDLNPTPPSFHFPLEKST